jgi:Na+-driven multidrug efflux pump
MNNVLRTYGAKSIYGPDTPIAAAGIIMKISVIFFALINGLINGAQPICSYNYGAQNYRRVRDTVKLVIKAAIIISTVIWFIFELFPQALICLFSSSEDDPLYLEFAIKFMRIYLFFVFINGVPICSATFFTAIGNVPKGTILSFAKQLVFRVPLLLILPVFLGLNGVMYAQVITDLLSFTLAIVFLTDEFKKMPQKNYS